MGQAIHTCLVTKAGGSNGGAHWLRTRGPGSSHISGAEELCEFEKVSLILIHEVRNLDKSRMASEAAWNTIFGRTMRWERIGDPLAISVLDIRHGPGIICKSLPFECSMS